MKAWTSLTDTSAVKTYREVPALRNNAFRELVVVVATATGGEIKKPHPHRYPVHACSCRNATIATSKS